MLAGMMKLMMLTCALAITGAATLGAQTSTETTTTTTTQIDLTGGKHVKVTGCVEPGPDGGFVLTHVFDKSGPHRYMLVSTNDFFAKHVGNRVQVEGRAADGRHGWAAIESETKTERRQHLARRHRRPQRRIVAALPGRGSHEDDLDVLPVAPTRQRRPRLEACRMRSASWRRSTGSRR